MTTPVHISIDYPHWAICGGVWVFSNAPVLNIKFIDMYELPKGCKFCKNCLRSKAYKKYKRGEK